MTDYIHTFDLTDRVTACIAYDDCFHDNVLRDMSHSDADESHDAYGASCYVAGGVGGEAGRILADRARKRLLDVIGAPVPA